MTNCNIFQSALEFTLAAKNSSSPWRLRHSEHNFFRLQEQDLEHIFVRWDFEQSLKINPYNLLVSYKSAQLWNSFACVGDFF